jgi:hypothetical protein
MRLLSLFAVWLVCGSSTAAQDAPKSHVRFFNDSAKAVDFYVDSQFGCSIPANPEQKNSYCDADAAMGKHTARAKGAKLASQSCDLYVESIGAEAHLSKGERLHCMSYAHD